MTFKRVIFINATLPKKVHEIIDASLILMLSKRIGPVEAYLQEDRQQNISNMLKDRCLNRVVRFHKTISLQKRCAINDFMAALIEICILLSKRDGNTLFVFGYINMFSCHLINLVSKISGKHCLLCIHSEMEIIDKDYKGSGYWYYLMNSFFTGIKYATNLKLFVLSEQILKNIGDRMDDIRFRHFFYTDHPYFCKDILRSKRKNKDDKIRIGVIGSVTSSPQRGFNNLKSFAQALIPYDSIEIQIISKISKELIKELPPNIQLKAKPNEFLPRDVYDSLINDLDYIYVPYPEGQFRYTASGAILDAITHLRPLLMHKTDYSIYLTLKFGVYGIYIDGLNGQELYEMILRYRFDDSLIRKQESFLTKIDPENISIQFGDAIIKSFS